MRKALVPFSLILLVLAATHSHVVAQAARPELHVELSRVVGFIKGQRYSLNRIKTELPELALQAGKAESEFNLAFGAGEKKILDAMREMLGASFPGYEKKLHEVLASKLASQPITRQLALDFIAQVESRARGELPSPVRETLLSYQFMGMPAEEFSRGYTGVFRTTGHPKAKGLDFQISYPASWKAAEGDRPNVVQKFMSRNGRGLEIIVLIVKDLPLPPGYKMTERELISMFVESELKRIAGSGFISGKPITLDGHRGGMFVSDEAVQRLDVTLKIRTLQFVTVRRGKLIMVQCMVSTPPGEEATLQERFNRLEPLFRLVGNSFILQEQYR